MPCDSVTIQTIKLAKAEPNILKKAFQSLGFTVSETQNKGNIILSAYYPAVGTVEWKQNKGLTLRSNYKAQQTITKITKEYSKQAVTWAAKKVGWNVKTETENSLSMTRG